MENTIPSITQRSILYMPIHAEIFMPTADRAHGKGSLTGLQLFS